MTEPHNQLIDSILREKSRKKMTWDQLADKLPIAGNSLRMAFSRKVVKQEFLEVICSELEIPCTIDKEHSLSEYVESILVRHFEFDDYKENYDNEQYLDGLPTRLWKTSEIKGNGEPRLLRTFQIVNNDMDDGSYKSILLGDLILCALVPRNSIIDVFRKNNLVGFLHWEKGIQFRLIDEHDATRKVFIVKSLSQPDLKKKISYSECAEFYKVLLIERKLNF